MTEKICPMCKNKSMTEVPGAPAGHQKWKCSSCLHEEVVDMHTNEL